MYIELLGLSGVRITTGDKTILLAPPGASSELKASNFKADIVVLGHPDDKINATPGGERLFTISEPGEYEAGGVFFYCLANPLSGEMISLLTSVTVEDVVVTHLGGLGRTLTPAELEIFEGTDVLLIPTGGQNVLSAKAASELVSELEPRVVIPMHAARPGLKTKYDEAGVFLKAMGAKADQQDKVKITKKDLPQDQMQIIHLA